MTVCIDTNVALTMFKPTHRNHALFLAWASERFTWAVAIDILLEYEEVMTRLGSADRADYVITEDRDFRPLAGAGFKPQPITPEEFIARHMASNPAP